VSETSRVDDEAIARAVLARLRMAGPLEGR
jgi:hypothetical protein